MILSPSDHRICTLITHENGTKSLIYERDPVEIGRGVAIIAYPKLSQEALREIQEATPDKIQYLLSLL